jgi:hypothetical protein
MASCRSAILPGGVTFCVSNAECRHTQYVNCEELWLVTEGFVACVTALESGEFQEPKCVNFFRNDFAPKVTLACCNGGFIAQRRFPSESLVAQLTHLLLVVGPIRSPSSSVPPSSYLSFSHFSFYFYFCLIWFSSIIIMIIIIITYCHRVVTRWQ